MADRNPSGTEYDIDRAAGEPARWDALFAAAPRPALEQSRPFGEAMEATASVIADRFAVVRDGTPVALVQAFRRRLIGRLTLVRLVRGPVWLREPQPDEIADILRTIRSAWRPGRGEILSFVPELAAYEADDAAMRACRMRRMVTGYSTVWLDLGRSLETLRAGLEGKWRNALVKAEGSGLRLRVAKGGALLDDLAARYDAFRKQRRFAGPEGALARALAGLSKDVTVLGAYRGSTLAAGAVVVRHGASATYFISWTGEDGRAANAHNLLLWRAVEMLKKDGVRWFDLGGVDAVHAPGVARFKLGMGGAVTTLAGSYL